MLLSQADIDRFNQLLKKANPKFSYDEILFICWKFHALRQEVLSPKLPPQPDKSPSVEFLLEVCKEKIESILLPLENSHWIKDQTVTLPDLDAHDTDPYNLLLSLRAEFAKKYTLPSTTTDVINKINRNKFIPFQLLHAIYLLPPWVAPTKVQKIVEEKVNFMKAIINKWFIKINLII